MGLFDKLKEKVAPAQPTLMEEIPKAIDWIKENMERFGHPLDGTHESFGVLDEFFEEQCKPGGLLAGKVRYMKNQLFAVGAYVGQVLVDELNGTWMTDDKAREGEALIGVQLPDGRVARPVQRAIRCFSREPGYTFVDFWDIVSNPPKPKEEEPAGAEGEEPSGEEKQPEEKKKKGLFGRSAKEREEKPQEESAPEEEKADEFPEGEDFPEGEEPPEDGGKKKRGLFGRSKSRE